MCIGRHRLQVSIDFFQTNMPHQHSPGKWDRKYESLQIRESHTRLCMRLVLMYARQPRPGPRPNRPSNGLLQGTTAIFLMYRYTIIPHAFMCLGKNQNAITIRKITNMNIQICQNIKQMPKKQSCFQLDGQVRECTVPKPGHLFQKILLSINNFLYVLRSLYLCFFLFGGGI